MNSRLYLASVNLDKRPKRNIIGSILYACDQYGCSCETGRESNVFAFAPAQTVPLGVTYRRLYLKLELTCAMLHVPASLVPGYLRKAPALPEQS